MSERLTGTQICNPNKNSNYYSASQYNYFASAYYTSLSNEKQYGLIDHQNTAFQQQSAYLLLLEPNFIPFQTPSVNIIQRKWISWVHLARHFNQPHISSSGSPHLIVLENVLITLCIRSRPTDAAGLCCSSF